MLADALELLKAKAQTNIRKDTVIKNLIEIRDILEDMRDNISVGQINDAIELLNDAVDEGADDEE